CMTPSRVRFMNTTTLLTGSSLSSAPAPCRLVTRYTNHFRPDRQGTRPRHDVESARTPWRGRVAGRDPRGPAGDPGGSGAVGLPRGRVVLPGKRGGGLAGAGTRRSGVERR